MLIILLFRYHSINLTVERTNRTSENSSSNTYRSIKGLNNYLFEIHSYIE